jgi:hypothetical protein
VIINPAAIAPGDTHMIKTIQSKYGEDLLLVSVCMIGCLGLYFLAAYFFVTFLADPA